MRKPGNRPNGLSPPDVLITLVDEIFTTAGKTVLTTGAKVAGMFADSRTAGAAAVAAAAGARPA